MTDTFPIQRPPSEQLVDLHVYLLPRESWNEKYHSTYNESISEARSAGFVRVWPELTVYDLRMVISKELGHDIVPPNFVFLRSVGRCMTQIRPKQELELKCKSFLPPAAWAPEIVVLAVEPHLPGVPGFQSYPGFSPRLDTTQPPNGMPNTHFPQVANHDRMGPLDGQNPLVQHALKGDPLGSIGGIPGGKSGRPDAYTNNTNEDSGIAEPTPEDDDPEFERRRSDVDDQHYDQSQAGQGQIRQFQTTSWDPAHRHQEQAREEEEKQRREEERRVEEERQRKEEEMVRQKREEELKEERRREEELKEERRREEEERRRVEERQLVLVEEKKRQEAVERKKKEEEEARQQREEMERRLEEELSREEEEEAERERREQEEVERMLEEERQQTIAERVRAERARAAEMDAAMSVDDEGEVGAIAMDTGRRSFTTDDEMRRRAEGELADYQPQSSWGEEPHPHPPMRSRQETQSRRRPAEDVAMEMASQEAVQDGLKRVHLTPEIHRKAKVGKIRRESAMDGEDMYETDPEMADLIEQLQAARQERLEKEKQRETLIKKAKELQAKTYDKRYKAFDETRPPTAQTPDKESHPRDYWKKRYFDEKKKTPRQEELVSRLRNQVELMHRKLLSHVEGKKNKAVGVKGPPSKKNDHKIAILKMQHDLDEIKRQVDNSRMKLTAEVKLRNQAEAEVRSLKSEVTQRKINMTLIRNQKIAALKSGQKKLLAKTPVPALGQSAGGMSGK